jgi:hypothetical protein
LLRRAGAAETGGGRRGCSGSGEDRDGAEQCVARLASLRPSGGPRRVGWHGEQVESGTRRRPLEPVLRQAGGMAKATRQRAGSLGVGRSSRNAQMATGTSGARCSSAAAMVAAAGLGVSREQGKEEAFIVGHRW